MVSENGLIYNCISSKGKKLSEKRYSWSMGRAMYSISYAIEMGLLNKSFIKKLKINYDFCKKNFLQNLNSIPYCVDKRGVIIDKTHSDFSLFFLLLGIIKADKLLKKYNQKIDDEDFIDLLIEKVSMDFSKKKFCHYPLKVKSSLNSLSKRMCKINYYSELYKCYKKSKYLKFSSKLSYDFIKEFNKYKFINENGGLDTNQVICPGHLIEACWFSIEGLNLDRDLEKIKGSNLRLLKKMSLNVQNIINLTWDKVNGGLYHSIKIKNNKISILNDTKTWWSAVELFVCLSYFSKININLKIDGQNSLVILFNYLNKNFFTDKGYDWIQKKSIDHKKEEKGIGLPVRDFFHYPRSALKLMENII